MVRRFFTATLAVAAVFASCAKDDGTGIPEGEAPRVPISIATPAMSRAVADAGQISNYNDTQIHNYTVLIADANGDFKWTAYVSGDEVSTSKNVNTTTAAKKVYVIANGGDLTSITSKTMLDSQLADLDGEVKQTKSDTSGPWSTGVSDDLIFDVEGDEYVAEAPIQLQFIAVRITLAIDREGDGMNDYGTNLPEGSLSLTGVAVLNARGESRLFPYEGSLIPATYSSNTKSYMGLSNPTGPDPAPFANYPEASDFSVKSELFYDASNALPNADFDERWVYYVFENNAASSTEQPTIVTVIGTYDGKPIYFPVHLTNAQWPEKITDEGLKRGNSYNIEIVLAGEPDIETGGNYPGETGGTPDPTVPGTSASVQVNITAATWTPVTLAKRFGD